MDDCIPAYTLPVPDEIDAHDLQVTGALPAELDGRYLRNGPNPRPGDPEGHWFTGRGMLHGVRLSGGRAVWYRNRWVHTPGLNIAGPDGPIDRRNGTANTAVREHAGRLFALVESSFPVEVDRDLGTVGACDFDGRLSTAMTAHPKEHPLTGELHFFGYGAVPPYLTYHRLAEDGKLVFSQQVEVGGPTMMHDFAITDRHVVWLDLPVVFDAALLGKTMPYQWNDDYPARIGVMPQAGGPVRWFDVDPCYVFHVGNAYEDDRGRIVLDAVRYDRPAWMAIWGDVGGVSGGGAGASRLHRWTLDPATGQARDEAWGDRGVEFPTLNDSYAGLPNRYQYVVGGDRLVKIDHAGRTEADAYGEGWHLGEAVFVPAENARAEDDGWLLSIATHDNGDVASHLLVHDATEVAAGAVATVRLPRRVPAGFHGTWLSEGTPE